MTERAMSQTHAVSDLQSCDSVRERFSDYLDGVTGGHAMQQIDRHLEACPACAEEFAAWQAVQQSLTALGRPKVPRDLGLKLRLAISRERSRRASGIFDTVALRWVNTFRPALVQVSAGFATAVALLGTVGFLLGAVAVPPAVLANDEPLGAMTPPHYRYSVARQRAIATPRDATIVVEAEVNERGEVFDYTIVSGPEDVGVRTQVEGQLLLSVFEPARVFGEAVRGRVIVTYAGVSVRA